MLVVFVKAHFKFFFSFQFSIIKFFLYSIHIAARRYFISVAVAHIQNIFFTLIKQKNKQFAKLEWKKIHFNVIFIDVSHPHTHAGQQWSTKFNLHILYLKILCTNMNVCCGWWIKGRFYTRQKKSTHKCVCDVGDRAFFYDRDVSDQAEL